MAQKDKIEHEPLIKEYAQPSDIAVATSQLNLLLLTAGYFILEIVINLMIFKQLSIKSDFFTIEAMEFWGKIITGLGAALMLVRYCYFRADYVKTRPKDSPLDSVFLLLSVCVITIPLSFIAQNQLISYMVKNATEDDRNKAVLVTAVHSTLKPHFIGDNTSNEKPSTFQKLINPIINTKDRFLDGYSKKEILYMNASIACTPISEKALGVYSNTDKAFFAYNAMKEPMRESLYKSIISDYHTCLYDNEEYSEDSVIGNAFPNKHWNIIGAYKEYRKASRQYDIDVSVEKMMAKSSNSPEVFKDQKKELDIKWRENMNDFLGFESTLKPMLTESEFVRHPDVKKYFVSKANNAEYIYPYDAEFDEKKDELIRLKLPHAVIPTYIDSSGEALGANMPVYRNSKGEKQWVGDDIEITDELILKRGELAYKAIIMPQVALGLSMLFLIFNALSVANAMFKIVTKHSKISQTNLVFIVGLALVIGMPSLLVGSKEADKAIANRSFVMKALYFHERNLASLFIGNEKKLERIETKNTD